MTNSSHLPKRCNNSNSNINWPNSATNQQLVQQTSWYQPSQHMNTIIHCVTAWTAFEKPIFPTGLVCAPLKWTMQNFDCMGNQTHTQPLFHIPNRVHNHTIACTTMGGLNQHLYSVNNCWKTYGIQQNWLTTSMSLSKFLKRSTKKQRAELNTSSAWATESVHNPCSTFKTACITTDLRATQCEVLISLRKHEQLLQHLCHTPELTEQLHKHVRESIYRNNHARHWISAYLSVKLRAQLCDRMRSQRKNVTNKTSLCSTKMIYPTLQLHAQPKVHITLVPYSKPLSQQQNWVHSHGMSSIASIQREQLLQCMWHSPGPLDEVNKHDQQSDKISMKQQCAKFNMCVHMYETARTALWLHKQSLKSPCLQDKRD